MSKWRQPRSVSAVDRFPLSDKADFTVRFGAARGDATFGGFSNNENGYLIGIGVRGRPGPMLELEGGIEYVDIGGSATGFKVDGRYFFTLNFSLGRGCSFFDEETHLRLLARYSCLAVPRSRTRALA
jgi:hypothetical protein